MSGISKKKHILFFCLTLSLLLNCSFFQEEKKRETNPIPNYSIQFNVYDHVDKTTVNNVTADVVGSNKSELLTNESSEVVLKKGIHNICIKKTDYIPMGYVIDLNKNIVINVELRKNYINTFSTENISGKFQINNNDCSNDYYLISTTDTGSAEQFITTANPTGAFSINTSCGDLTLSAYTKDFDGKISEIVYQKNISLASGSPINGILLNYLNPSNHSGAKPQDGNLIVKLLDYSILARQEVGSNTTNYNFNIDLSSDDSFILESVKYDGLNTLFTRKNSSGDITYPVNLPNITVSESDYYLINFDVDNNVSYYEGYVIEVNGSNSNIAYKLVNVAKKDIRIPSDYINQNADLVVFYLTAILLEDYDQDELLLGDQNILNYSYAEVGNELVSRSIERSIKNELYNYRKINQNNSLVIE